MNETRVRFEYELLEDLHAGTGVGRLGLVDDVQARDSRGWPVVWMSSFRGVLRESGRDYLEALGRDQRLVESLFGKRGDTDGKAVVTSLRLVARPDRPCVVWASTARQAGSRRPDDHTLRFVEFAPAGLRLRGEARLLGADGEEEAFLRDCLKRVTALGGRRTRGWGSVRLHMLEQEVGAGAAPPGPPTVQGPWRLRLVLENLEPLALARTAYAGNLVPSRSFLPGATLRGALLHWLSSRGQGDTAGRLSQAMSVGNAYPVGDADGLVAEVVPAPASLREPKGGGDGVAGPAPWWDAPAAATRVLFAQGEVDLLASPPAPGGRQTKRIKAEEYLVREPGRPWLRVRPRMGVLLHNEVPVSRREGSPQGDDDSFFSQQVIWEGQRFATDLIFTSHGEAAAFVEDARGLFGGSWLLVGRGGRPVRVAAAAWGERPHAGPATPGRLTVTLTSDLIARTPWLNFYTRLTPEALGLPPGLMPEAFGEETEAHGYNTASGLPRAPALAIRRGAVVRLTGELGLVEEARRMLAAGGPLGERVEDGFGRFALDLDVHDPAGPAMPGPAPVQEWRDNPREAVLARAAAFIEGHGPKLRAVSASRWQALRELANAGHPVPALLDDLVANCARLSGRAWEGVAALLREATLAVAGEHRGFFIDMLARRVVAELQAGEVGR